MFLLMYQKCFLLVLVEVEDQTSFPMFVALSSRSTMIDWTRLVKQHSLVAGR